MHGSRAVVPLALSIDEVATEVALTRSKTQCLDGYDLLILETNVIAALDRIRAITHDSDNAVVSGIQVFTSKRMFEKG